MRKNTQKTWQAWQQNKASKVCQAIWTDGRCIYSYGTCLVALAPDESILLNRTRYSVTTTIHQNALAVLLRGHVREVSNVPRNASPEHLVFAAKEGL